MFYFQVIHKLVTKKDKPKTNSLPFLHICSHVQSPCQKLSFILFQPKTSVWCRIKFFIDCWSCDPTILLRGYKLLLTTIWAKKMESTNVVSVKICTCIWECHNLSHLYAEHLLKSIVKYCNNQTISTINTAQKWKSMQLKYNLSF